VVVFVGSVWLFLWGLCGCICGVCVIVFVGSVCFFRFCVTVFVGSVWLFWLRVIVFVGSV
jgi:hypothetical protein